MNEDKPEFEMPSMKEIEDAHYLSDEQIEIIRDKVNRKGKDKIPELDIINDIDDFVKANGTEDERYKRLMKGINSLYDLSDTSLSLPAVFSTAFLSFFLLAYFFLLMLVKVDDVSDLGEPPDIEGLLPPLDDEDDDDGSNKA